MPEPPVTSPFAKYAIDMGGIGGLMHWGSDGSLLPVTPYTASSYYYGIPRHRATAERTTIEFKLWVIRDVEKAVRECPISMLTGNYYFHGLRIHQDDVINCQKIRPPGVDVFRCSHPGDDSRLPDP
jgi:hypothetical protein